MVLNLKGHKNWIIGSKVKAILLNGWILPIGGVSPGMVLTQPAKQACSFPSPNNLKCIASTQILHEAFSKQYRVALFILDPPRWKSPTKLNERVKS